MENELDVVYSPDRRNGERRARQIAKAFSALAVDTSPMAQMQVMAHLANMLSEWEGTDWIDLSLWATDDEADGE